MKEYQSFLDVAGEDGDTIIIKRQKALNIFKQALTSEEQKTALKKYLKKPSNRPYSVGSLVMKDISLGGKISEKSYALKVIHNNFS